MLGLQAMYAFEGDSMNFALHVTAKVQDMGHTCMGHMPPQRSTLQ